MGKTNRPLVRTESLRFRVSKEEKQLIAERAKIHGITMTEYIVSLVIAEAEGGGLVIHRGDND